MTASQRGTTTRRHCMHFRPVVCGKPARLEHATRISVVIILKQSLCVIKHQAMKTCGEVEVNSKHS
jgi:hypothetical protein